MSVRILVGLLALTALAHAAAPAQTAVERVLHGNQAFAVSNYDAAVQAYAGAQVDLPESPEVAYNLGLCYYRQGKYDKALASLEKALATDDALLEARVHYTIGNTLVQQGKLRESLDAYKQCLARNRNDQDAKYNIEYVQRKLKELASKQKDDQEKDPLNKLLKELERLITLQAENVVGTMALWSFTNEPAAIAAPLEHVYTNEVNYAARTHLVREGFRDLRTNLPPERLNSTGQAQAPGGTNTTAKTLAEKIDNAVRYLAVAKQRLTRAAAALGDGTWTNAPPDQKKGLEYLIKARKEFDDKQQQQEQQKNQQDQNKNKDKDKDKQQNKDKDKDKNKDQEQQQPQPQQQQPQQQKDQQQQQQQQPQMSKQQAEQMLRSVDEDQRNRRKAHKRALGVAPVRPVDVDL
jgi:tetratricopeptide (TPR) repeat protein